MAIWCYNTPHNSKTTKIPMYIDVLGQLGLTKNEAKIYQTLLENGESSVGTIATEAAINRRNVYDTLNRLVEKGLIFEIRKHNENAYQAVDPKKLGEIIKEKEQALAKVMPELKSLYEGTPTSEAVYIYHGVEGWKNYMRDILRIGQDVYTIGGDGAWGDPKLETFLKGFIKEAEAKKVGFNILFDHEVKLEQRPILNKLETNHKFLPAGFSTDIAIDAFGDYVVITKSNKKGEIDENASAVVIVNKAVADGMRQWHHFMWQTAGKFKTKN